MIGADARGRKQYRYHRNWRAVRDEAKYERVMSFARALPRIRGRVESDMKLAGLPKETLYGQRFSDMGRDCPRGDCFKSNGDSGQPGSS